MLQDLRRSSDLEKSHILLNWTACEVYTHGHLTIQKATMETNTHNLVKIFLLFQICIVVFAATSSQNQIWWSKRIKAVQKGCAGMCCTGQNGTCFGTGPKMAGATSQHGRCYCDESCLNMKDCCEDYSVECQGLLYNK